VAFAAFLLIHAYLGDMVVTAADEERLLPYERHLRILDQARNHSRVEVSALADELDVTSETIRRDLAALERRGLVRRVHGGAVHMERLGYEPSVTARREQRTAEKSRIGRAARDLLPDGGAILVDAGTTTMELVRALPSDLALTVVTNSVQAASFLAELPRIELLLLGGRIRDVTGAAVGAWTRSALADLRVDVAFMGTNGITPDRGLTTPDQAEAEVKAAMVAAAARVVCLVDHSKVGLSQLCRFASLDLVDVVVTDSGLEQDLADELAAAGPEVIRA
jgi:DeoR family transcriptional regulator, fructose operon transcriptional repressor